MLDAIARAADLIHEADALVIAAGAGMGVDSGLPDFRGNDGFWQAYPALAEARLSFAEVATPRTQRPVVIELGAGTPIPSVRAFGHHVLQRHGGRLVRINPRDAEVPRRLDVSLATGALAGLLAVDAALKRRA